MVQKSNLIHPKKQNKKKYWNICSLLPHVYDFSVQTLRVMVMASLIECMIKKTSRDSSTYSSPRKVLSKCIIMTWCLLKQIRLVMQHASELNSWKLPDCQQFFSTRSEISRLLNLYYQFSDDAIMMIMRGMIFCILM